MKKTAVVGLVKSAALIYAAGAVGSVGYWAYKSGSPVTALKGDPRRALGVAATWPLWLYRFKKAQSAAK